MPWRNFRFWALESRPAITLRLVFLLQGKYELIHSPLPKIMLSSIETASNTHKSKKILILLISVSICAFFYCWFQNIALKNPVGKSLTPDNQLFWLINLLTSSDNSWFSNRSFFKYKATRVGTSEYRLSKSSHVLSVVENPFHFTKNCIFPVSELIRQLINLSTS